MRPNFFVSLYLLTFSFCHQLRLHSDHAFTVIETLCSDSDALCSMGVTDYSLLVGVKNVQYDVAALSTARAVDVFAATAAAGAESDEPSVRFSGIVGTEQQVASGDPVPQTVLREFPARAVLAPAAYYMGIIDILQSWTLAKRIERLVKVYFLGEDAAGVSCMAPEDFRTRFQQKIGRIVEHSIFVREVTGSWQGNRYCVASSVASFVNVLCV